MPSLIGRVCHCGAKTRPRRPRQRARLVCSVLLDVSRRSSPSPPSSSALSGSPKLPIGSPGSPHGSLFPCFAMLTSTTQPYKISSNAVEYPPMNGHGGLRSCIPPPLSARSISCRELTPRIIPHPGLSSRSLRTKSDPPATLSQPCMTSLSLSRPSHVFVLPYTSHTHSRCSSSQPTPSHISPSSPYFDR